MESKPKHLCHKEKLINTHNNDIVELKVRDDFNEQRLDELTKELAKMDEKLDRISEDIQGLKLQSAQDDFNIDNRVKSLESKLETLKWIVTIAVSGLSVIVAFMAFIFSHII